MSTNQGFSLEDHQLSSEAIGNTIADLAALEKNIVRKYPFQGGRIQSTLQRIDKVRRELKQISGALSQEMQARYPFANENYYGVGHEKQG